MSERKCLRRRGKKSIRRFAAEATRVDYKSPALDGAGTQRFIQLKLFPSFWSSELLLFPSSVESCPFASLWPKSNWRKLKIEHPSTFLLLSELPNLDGRPRAAWISHQHSPSTPHQEAARKLFNYYFPAREPFDSVIINFHLITKFSSPLTPPTLLASKIKFQPRQIKVQPSKSHENVVDPIKERVERAFSAVCSPNFSLL